MVCGLNLWDEKIKQGKINRGVDSIKESELRFHEPRLENVLEVDYFVKPFEYKEKGETNNYLSIPAVRFPGWQQTHAGDIVCFQHVEHLQRRNALTIWGQFPHIITTVVG